MNAIATLVKMEAHVITPLVVSLARVLTVSLGLTVNSIALMTVILLFASMVPLV